MKKINYLISFLLAVSFINTSAQESQYSTYYYQRASLFEQLPVDSDDIIFLGNSITDGGEWAELFGNPNVKNQIIESRISIK